MATRSMIAMKVDNQYRAVYCHYDGYPSHQMPILQQNYLNPDKVKELIDLGSLSILASEIGQEHNFDTHDSTKSDWCLAYHRDRGETLQISTTRDLKTLVRLAKECGAEYIYIYKQGYWECRNLYITQDDVSLDEISKSYKKEIAMNVMRETMEETAVS